MSATYLKPYEVEAGAFMNSSNRALANLECSLDIDNKAVQNTGKFYDVFDGSNDLSSGLLDTTATTTTSAYSSGVSTVAVSSVTGFVAGMEVTIYDDVGSEDKIIQSVGASSLTFTTVTVNAYKNGAGVARSSVVLSGGKMGFGSISLNGLYAIHAIPGTPRTYGSAKKLVRMGNGDLVYAVQNNTIIEFYRSTNSGVSWTSLFYISGAATNCSNASLVANGNILKVLWTSPGSGLCCNSIDVTTTGYGDANSSKVSIAGGTYSYGCDMDIDGNGYLHVFGSMVTGTYPNSVNILYWKSTNGGTSWSGSTYITSYNTSGQNNTYPSCRICNGNPIVTYCLTTTAPQTVFRCSYWNGSSWLGAYTIANITPSVTSWGVINAFVDASNVIHVVFLSPLASSGIMNIHYSRSSDYGATWSTTDLTTGNYQQSIPVIAGDTANRLYIYWYGYDTSSINQVKRIIFDGAWGSVTNLTSDVTASTDVYAVSNYISSSEPSIVYQDATNTECKILGVTSLITSVARYNITPPLGTAQNFTAWVQHDRATPDANFAVAASSSIVASNANESFTSMTKATTNFNSSLAEEAFTMSDVTANAKMTLKLTLIRASTANTEKVTKLLGAINR